MRPRFPHERFFPGDAGSVWPRRLVLRNELIPTFEPIANGLSISFRRLVPLKQDRAGDQRFATRELR
jgi:hypothetical protein